MSSPRSPQQKIRILRIARAAVADALNHRPTMPPQVDPQESDLLEPRGCFVTLRQRDGRLRGCIGTFEADRPLLDNLVRMARAAARDPRFVGAEALSADELASLCIEVSILTPRREIENPLDLRLGVEGIYMTAGTGSAARRGCFLPQVATEQGWDLETTLSQCCAGKMGLEPDAWRRRDDLRFEVFEAEIIDEAEISEGGRDV